MFLQCSLNVTTVEASYYIIDASVHQHNATALQMQIIDFGVKKASSLLKLLFVIDDKLSMRKRRKIRFKTSGALYCIFVHRN